MNRLIVLERKDGYRIVLQARCWLWWRTLRRSKVYRSLSECLIALADFWLGAAQQTRGVACDRRQRRRFARKFVSKVVG